MTNRLLHSRKYLTTIFSLLFFVVSFLTYPVQSTAQTRSSQRERRVQIFFAYNPTRPAVGQDVQFQDFSRGNPTSWLWDFGDGQTSILQNPRHAFPAPGSYRVALTARNGTSSGRTSRTLNVILTVSASFSYGPAYPLTGQAVQFTDTSTGGPTSWLWNFGDNTTSTTQNPSHTYTAAGSYTVTLTVGFSSGSKTVSQTITVAPSLVASFTFSPSSPTAGQTVQFMDTSTGSPTSWIWNFGDNTSSTSQNPVHTYATVGSYTVTLTVTYSSGSKSASRTINVVTPPALTASFTYSPSSPVAGQSVQFTDTSTGSPTSWLWNFGDNTTSSTKNPIHIYSTAATYTVTLTVTNSSASKSVSRTVNILPASTLTASFTYSPSFPTPGQAVQFTDTSTGSPTSWQWNFGDNATSTLRNPSHSYAATGQYWVNLIITKGTESHSTSQMITVRTSGTITAASPSFADVRAAVSAAVPGDTVIVPAGTATWSSQLVITKSVSLIGAGIGQTIITSGFSGTEYSSNNFIIYYNVENDSIKSFRVSGFTFDGGGLCEPLRIDNQSIDGSEARIRIDHCTFQNIGSHGALYWQWGTVYGVVDNCIFNPNDTATIPPRGRCIVVLGNNYVSWMHTAYDFGDVNNLYFEDCIFYWQDMPFQGGGGGRYAIRHCTFNYIGIQSGTAWGLDNHGNYSGGNYSGFGVEVYDNTWNMNGYPINLIDMRGGKGLIYNNYFQNAGPYIVAQVREESNDNNNPPSINPINGQPQHLSDFYIWNTYRNMTKYFHPTNKLPFVGGTIVYGDKGVVPREDVHFWREVPSFIGSTGMGSGPLLSRPSSCALEGAAWWASDENRLYRWHNGAWQLYYTPYTYPHPLRK